MLSATRRGPLSGFDHPAMIKKKGEADGQDDPVHRSPKDTGSRGRSNCDFVARTETEDEALAEFTDHMQTVHNWNEIFEPDLEKVRVQNVHNDV